MAKKARGAEIFSTEVDNRILVGPLLSTEYTDTLVRPTRHLTTTTRFN